MHLPRELQRRFHEVIRQHVDDPGQYSGMIRPTNDPKFGDYQCNAAMPLAKKVGGTNPRELAAQMVDALSVSDLCETPEVAGPGFINLKIRDSWILDRVAQMTQDDRCGVAAADQPRKVIIDFSSPNVAKPMHVGHIRSTVIGDALARVLNFLGHHTITDNHLGDWGTQFGIIIFGYKNFGDPDTVAKNPVPELAKLYRLVNQISEYQKACHQLPASKQSVHDAESLIEELTGKIESAGDDAKAVKSLKKNLSAAKKRLQSARDSVAAMNAKMDAVQTDEDLLKISQQYPDIAQRCLLETAKLHEGDQENLDLWTKFLPYCRDEIDRIYDRLDVQFDHTLGESFYHDRLPGVVDQLSRDGIATESEGAICVFLDQFDAPMIIRKKDGAFLYATTDLATLQYRREEFAPDEILYVVDTRQSEHFDKLFAVARRMGMEDVRLVHVNFGTVLGADGRPLKTRSGTLIGLESLLDDAVARAQAVVCDPERLQRMDPPMTADEQQSVAETVGIGAIKFADLSHHRTSDYQFNLDKMVALDGNTATYIQYSYARTQSILRRAEMDEEAVVALASKTELVFSQPQERALALRLLQFEEALVSVYEDYAPNQLTDYLFETARAYAVFNDTCPVLKAETDQMRATRLVLVVLCGRLLRKGLELLGIGVAARM
ncbi:Arginine--tRNA ligase [Crateriforma conspicua]|uniref:Arginine--tRNA ligase n=1 Tax=Crateriforma conspicua TaxID=2527996 RepID=A0A5C6FWZ5_9PLAN|nr:arginine--tRNA ligase [Crateriforma conspicua]TWU66981.1 Arginine--tRNA ligase [Crateriforma conspicua]